MDYNINFTDIQLSQHIQSYKGIKIKESLKEKIAEEEKMLDLINSSIFHCNRQIDNYNNLKKEGKYKEASTFEKIKNTFISNKSIWNIAGFITLVSIDIKTIQLGIYFAENEWHKRFYARQACVIIYESCNDILELLGKEFKKDSSHLKNINDIETSLIKIRKDLNVFKKSHSNYLQNVRNHTMAHKDKDVLKQLNIIKDINWSNTIEIIVSFEENINSLGAVLKDLIQKGIKQLEYDTQQANINKPI